MSAKGDLNETLLQDHHDTVHSIYIASKSSSLRITDRIVYLEKLLRYSGCWVFVGRKYFGDYIGLSLVILVIFLEITSDYMLYFGSNFDRNQCDLSTFFKLFAVLRHIEMLFRLSFFVFKFQFIWKDPWISRHILNFEADFEEEEDGDDDEPVLRKITSSFLANWNIQSVPPNYDYINQNKRSRKHLFNRFKTKVTKKIKSKLKKHKYPFKSQKMYKRIKLHCFIGCIVISIVTVIYRMSVAMYLADGKNTIGKQSQSNLLISFQIVLIIGSVWTNLSMIIFFAVIFVYNFIAIRYIKFYFHRIITSCFSNLHEHHSHKVLKDLDGSNILQEYDDMYYFIKENNERVEVWVAWLIFYVTLNWWIFLSLVTYGCDIYERQSLSNIAYCILYTVNLMILTWSGLRVTKEFNALSTNIADITEEVQFGYSRLSQFTQYARSLDCEISRKTSVDTTYPMSDDDYDHVYINQKHEKRSSGMMFLREYNKIHSNKLLRIKKTDDFGKSSSMQPLNEDNDSGVVRIIVDDKEETMSLIHIGRLMQLCNVLTSRPCAFEIFGITFTKSRIYGGVAAFAVGKVVTVAMNWSFKLD